MDVGNWRRRAGSVIDAGELPSFSLRGRGNLAARIVLQSLLPGQLSTLATEFSGSGLMKGWRLTSAFRYETTDSAFGTLSENRRQSFRISLSRRSLNLAA